MKNINAILFLALMICSCSGPNHSASNRISTAPLSQDPTETIPPTGQNNTTTEHKIQPKTGSAPTNEQLPAGDNRPSQTDSTAKR